MLNKKQKQTTKLNRTRAVQKVMFSCFNFICSAVAKRIIGVNKIMLKFMFAQVTEANPEPIQYNYSGNMYIVSEIGLRPYKF